MENENPCGGEGRRDGEEVAGETTVMHRDTTLT